MKMSGQSETIPTTFFEAASKSISTDEALMQYVSCLPSILSNANESTIEEYDSGITSTMLGGIDHMIDVVYQIILHLATWFPKKHFGNTKAKLYFHKFMNDRFEWRAALMEPEGPLSGGTVALLGVYSMVFEDLKDVVEEMVDALLFEKSFDLTRWKHEWKKIC